MRILSQVVVVMGIEKKALMGGIISHHFMIKIYTTPICAYCKQAKDYFKSKNLSYEEIGLVGNQEAQQLVISKTGAVSVPVIEINGNYVVGFNRQQIDKLL